MDQPIQPLTTPQEPHSPVPPQTPVSPQVPVPPQLPIPLQTPALATSTTDVKKGTSKVTWGITIISAISLTLTLLGYGVSLAVETTFGIPHETVYASVTDLIGLSLYAVIPALMGLGKLTWGPLFQQAWPPSLIGAGVCFFMFLCALVFSRYLKDRTGDGMKRFFRVVALPVEQSSTKLLAGKGLIGSILFGGVMFITPFVMVAALMTSIVLISTVPMIGMQLGENYLHEFVTAPTACLPVRTRTTLMRAWSARQQQKAAPASAATCVTLLKDKDRVASGRVIVSTSTTILLFEPVSGSTRRVPINLLTVVPIDTVPPGSTP